MCELACVYHVYASLKPQFVYLRYRYMHLSGYIFYVEHIYMYMYLYGYCHGVSDLTRDHNILIECIGAVSMVR